MTEERIKSMCENIKNEDENIVRAKITSTKLKKDIEILMK